MSLEESAAGQSGGGGIGWRRLQLGDLLIRVRERFVDRIAGAHAAPAINSGLRAMEMAAPPDLAARLKHTLNDLIASVMDETGARIDYEALRNCPAYLAYQEECLAALQRFQPHELPTEADQRAFWINLYNTLVLDAVINFEVKSSVTDGLLGIIAFFRRAAYMVDGRRVSLEDIEQGILRGNRGNPFVPGNHFASNDPRLAWSLPLDPRVHFALNCGGRSCPPIRAYSGPELDKQLDLAARSFVSGTVQLDPEKDRLSLSRIFRWYRKDFGGKEELIKFLHRTLPAGALRDYLSASGDRARIVYQPYDWTLNGK